MHREHPCVHKVVLSPACPSPVSPLPITRVSTPSRSACFCCVASGFLYPCPVVPAGVAVHSIPVATAAQRAPWQGCWVQGVSHWSLPQRGRVSANVRVQDMDLAAPNQLDNRRIEVVVDGLPLFHGAQLAVDTTLVSPLRRDGTPHPRCANVDCAALDTARRRKETTYPELHGRNGRTRLVVLGAEVGGRWSDEIRPVCPPVGQGESERGASNPPQSGPTSVDTQVVFHPGLQHCQVSRIVVAGASGRPWRGRGCAFHVRGDWGRPSLVRVVA